MDRAQSALTHSVPRRTKVPNARGLSILFIAVVAVALLMGGVFTASAQASVGYSTEEIAFLELINNYRASRGLQTLLVSDALSESGDRHDSDMGKYGFFGHYTQNSDWFAVGASPWDRMAASGYSYNTWMGENIAAGYSTASAVFTAWKNSPDHNENMINPNFRVIGVSLVYVSGSAYHEYWTTDFGGFVDPTAHTLGSSPSTTLAPSTTTTTAYIPPSTTTTTAHVPWFTTTTTAYVPPPTTTTTAYVPPPTTTTTTTAYVPPSTTTTTAHVPPSTTTTSVVSTPVFADVNGGTLYADQIWLVAQRGIVTGYGNGMFGPYAKVTRQQFAKMIVLALGYSAAPVSACTFEDVGTEPNAVDPHYPAGYIAACAALGITVGKTPSTFCPYEQVSRAQLITMVARAANLSEAPWWYQPSFAAFSPEHYPWARRAAYAGLLDGFVGVGPSFNFWASATRGEVCLLLANLMGG